MTLGYKIAFKKSVSRDLKKISKEEADKILDKINEDLSKKADAYTILTGKFSGLRKYRSGDYRVIYTIMGNNVIILRIRHRRDAYK